jgi:arsenite methyltransferase
MTTTADELREEVRQRYAAAARAVTEGSNADCCGGGSCCGDAAVDAFGESLYTTEAAEAAEPEGSALPPAVSSSRHGCC